MALKIKNVSMIEVGDWDQLVVKTYGKPYCFQQQDGCKERGTFNLTVPDSFEEYYPDTIPVKINGEEMGVSFDAWLARRPNRQLDIWWERNFYPDVQAIANDLHAKGLLPAGEYVINIDW